ncbi:MAG: glycosyltransferase family 9 protein [Caldimicrobium sp.]
MKEKKRILVYRRGGLGDTLLIFPLLENFKKLGYQVYFLGNSDYIGLAKLCGFADAAYSGEFLPHFLRKPFEKKIVISFDGNLNPYPPQRIWLPIYYLQSLGLPLDFSKKLPLSINKQSSKSPHLSKVAVIHPGSGSSKKNPPLSLFEKIENLLLTYGYTPIYFLGPAEKNLLSFKTNVYYSTNIIDTLNFLHKAQLFIGNDSGISHLASFLGLKCFLFFGPSDEIIYRPIGENVEILSLPLTCRPCFPKVCEERTCLNEKELWKVFLKAFST